MYMRQARESDARFILLTAATGRKKRSCDRRILLREQGVGFLQLDTEASASIPETSKAMRNSTSSCYAALLPSHNPSFKPYSCMQKLNTPDDDMYRPLYRHKVCVPAYI